MTESLPPCTPELEGAVRVRDGRALECRGGRWRAFTEEDPPARIRALDGAADLPASLREESDGR